MFPSAMNQAYSGKRHLIVVLGSFLFPHARSRNFYLRSPVLVELMILRSSRFFHWDLEIAPLSKKYT